METATNLKEALAATREQMGGITIDLIARIIVSVFDTAEVRALIEGLEKHNDKED